MLDWPLPFHSLCPRFLPIQVQACLRVLFQVTILESASQSGVQGGPLEVEKHFGPRNSGAEKE